MEPKHQSFIDLLKQINSEKPQTAEYEEVSEEMEDLPLLEETDLAILMHRDAHFSGDFATMLDYYAEEGKGASPEFSLDRIQYLWDVELQLQTNLAALFLSGASAEKVAAAKAAYKKLRDLYDDDTAPPYALLVTDLILSEEDPPQEAIDAVLGAGRSVVPALLELLRSDRFYDELFPGYGQAPALAAECLGKMGIEQAIKPLFEAVRGDDFFTEESMIAALVAIGQAAKTFLLTRLHSRPITADNERAAMILSHFKEDPEISKNALEQLNDPAVMKLPRLAAHLVLSCENLETDADRKKFKALAKAQATPAELREDIDLISRQWSK